MTQYIEDFLPPIQNAGLNTQESVSVAGTATFSGSIGVVSTTAGGLSGASVAIAVNTGTGGIYYIAAFPNKSA